MTNSNRPGAKTAAAAPGGPGKPLGTLRHKFKSAPNLADAPEQANPKLHKCSSEGLLGARVPTLEVPQRKKRGFRAKRVRSFGDLTVPSLRRELPGGPPGSPSDQKVPEAFDSSSSEEEIAGWGAYGSPQSVFEAEALRGWDEAARKGLFRYDVMAVATKPVPGRYGFIAQLNEGRASKKRPTEFSVDRVVQPFDAAKFNFTKASQEEVLFAFKLSPRVAMAEFRPSAEVRECPHLVMINVSPIEYGHLLLVPRVWDELPQQLDPGTVSLALHMAAEADNPYFRVGFNSLGAYATINHLHFQAYYMSEPYPCELAPVKALTAKRTKRAPTIGLLQDFPVRGLVFEVTNCLEMLAEVVGEACQKLAAANVPHNVMIMDRGARVFLFPQRFSVMKAKGLVPEAVLDTEVNPACFEIAGHMVLKRKADYDGITEEKAWAMLELASYPAEEFAELVDLCVGDYLR